jgi:hypothetical protein
MPTPSPSMPNQDVSWAAEAALRKGAVNSVRDYPAPPSDRARSVEGRAMSIPGPLPGILPTAQIGRESLGLGRGLFIASRKLSHNG